MHACMPACLPACLPALDARWICRLLVQEGLARSCQALARSTRYVEHSVERFMIDENPSVSVLGRDKNAVPFQPEPNVSENCKLNLARTQIPVADCRCCNAAMLQCCLQLPTYNLRNLPYVPT